MFSKAKQKIAEKIDRPFVPSIISANLHITGNLESDGDIQVDGRVDGDIRSQKLTISETAIVNGVVEADSVMVAGQVNGKIRARDLALTRTSRVIADVVQERLSIESGAYFEGNCRHAPKDGLKDANVITVRKIEAVPSAGALKGPNDSLRKVGGGLLSDGQNIG
jgi:cytoskeletal protein CcmA (bactofilin family)